MACQAMTDRPTETLSTGAGAPMTPEQAAELKRLASDAFEHDAFGPHLTQTEAFQRIAALKAKLKLLDEPPHTL
jgi:hypothetical protein